MAAAPWLPAIGSAPSNVRTGFAALEAALYLTGLATPTDLIGLVAWHTGAWFEADQRGQRAELQRIPAPPADDLQVVTMLHLVVGLDGQPKCGQRRMSDRRGTVTAGTELRAEGKDGMGPDDREIRVGNDDPTFL